jgi:myo-inositol-1(or 4)-monophosphatase
VSGEALEIARQVAAEAAALLRQVDDVGQVRTKATFKDLVTEWDMRVDELIARRLEALTPDIPRLAEESGASASGAERAARQWVIDPIDGTVNFAHKVPFYAVCISLEERGEPVCGVIHAPALRWEFTGARGGGAFRNGERLRVSKTAQLDQALLATGFPYDLGTAQWANFREWEHLQRTAGACRRFGSASLDLAMVACGWFDGYWEAGLQPWDLSAGALLVHEAGGRVTGLRGERFSSSAGHALASNGAVHQQLLDELAAVEARFGPRSI